MKTKLLILAALVFAGLTFSSCQKDNSFADETSLRQSEHVSSPDQPSIPTDDFNIHPGEILKLTPMDGDPDPGGIGNDMITNVPDPFRNSTMIKYIVKKPSKVSLAVYRKGGQELVAVLVKNESQQPGLKSVKFNATGLPYGKYIAKLVINTGQYSAIYKEEMTKSALWHQDDESAVTD